MVTDYLSIPILSSKKPPTVAAVSISSTVDLRELAAEQIRSQDEFKHLRANTGLRLALRSIPGAPSFEKILCDVAGPSPMSLVPASWVPAIFNHFHHLSHTGGSGIFGAVLYGIKWGKMFCPWHANVRLPGFQEW